MSACVRYPLVGNPYELCTARYHLKRTTKGKALGGVELVGCSNLVLMGSLASTFAVGPYASLDKRFGIEGLNLVPDVWRYPASSGVNRVCLPSVKLGVGLRCLDGCSFAGVPWLRVYVGRWFLTAADHQLLTPETGTAGLETGRADADVLVTIKASNERS